VEEQQLAVLGALEAATIYEAANQLGNISNPCRAKAQINLVPCRACRSAAESKAGLIIAQVVVSIKPLE
jgi:hypothetical protein